MANLVCSHTRSPERETPPHPGAQALLDRLPQPERRPGNHERTRRFRKHEPAVRHEGNGQADGRPGEERRASPGERFSQIKDASAASAAIRHMNTTTPR